MPLKNLCLCASCPQGGGFGGTELLPGCLGRWPTVNWDGGKAFLHPILKINKCSGNSKARNVFRSVKCWDGDLSSKLDGRGRLLQVTFGTEP